MGPNISLQAAEKESTAKGAYVFGEILLRPDGQIQWIWIVHIRHFIVASVFRQQVPHQGLSCNTVISYATLQKQIIGRVKWRPQRRCGRRQNYRQFTQHK